MQQLAQIKHTSTFIPTLIKYIGQHFKIIARIISLPQIMRAYG